VKCSESKFTAKAATPIHSTVLITHRVGTALAEASLTDKHRQNTMLPSMSGPRTGRAADIRGASQRAIAAACLGNAAEWYDFAIYGALATVIGVVFFPTADLATALSAAFAAYGTALFIRPLGALFFGRLGDTHGRRTVLVKVVFLMAGATAAVAFLPGYATIGLLAPLLLMLLRAAQGLSAGGELGVAAVFILENAPRSGRGQGAAWHTATMAVGIGTGMAVAGLLSDAFGQHGVESGWWRLAFLLALPLGLIGVHLRRRVAETEQFAAIRAASSLVDHPARELWNHHRYAVRRGFCLIAAGSLAFNTFFVFMPNNLISRHGASLDRTLLVTAGSLSMAAAAALVLGAASDRVGRRPVVIGSTAALVVLATPMSLLATGGSLVGLFVAEVLIGVAVAGVLSVSMLGELFPSSVRSTGFALTAGLATALIGGTGPWIAQILVSVTGAEVVPGLYVAAMAGLALVVLRTWPETAFNDLD
jgi:MHS family proline/betaine transporter-like MFS transporter